MDQIGKYQILDKIGAGGFAVVYKGYDPFIKRPVAIKVCYSRDQETRDRFYREAEIAGRLEHPNITAVYEFGFHDNMPYLVEEYLPGEDLAQMIRRGKPEGLEDKIQFLLQIASGLHHAHTQKVIHRDIKPSNIRILENGRVKIMDFGTAKLANVESNLTQTGMTLGTVAYLSPERLLGQPSGLNSDLFSYGVLAYELLSLQRPFVGRNIPNLIDQVLNTKPVPLDERWPECPERLAEVVHRCLEKDPEARYPACDALIQDLEQIRNQLGFGAPFQIEESSTTITQIHLQIAGLLDRARLLHERGKHQRAQMLISEVLEIVPNHAEARDLMTACREAARNAGPDAEGGSSSVSSVDPSQTQMWEGPDERRVRKIGEAVTSIEEYVRAGKLVRAVQALRFATDLLGSFEESLTLRLRIVGSLRHDVAAMRDAGRTQARRIVETMADLRRRGLLPPAPARRLAEQVEALDPDEQAAWHIVAAIELEAARKAQKDGATPPQPERLREAIDSIERLLSNGDPKTAEEALRFAVQLFGEFDQIPQLRQRISDARRALQSGPGS